LLLSPDAVTVGASGAIFGILGALFVLERRRHIATGGQVAALIVLNLIFTFAVSNISVGGHIGGLIGGVVLMWMLLQTRNSAAYSIAATAAVIVVSIIVAYAKVRTYT
jgi:membrane associated rhomboid family serine protease